MTEPQNILLDRNENRYGPAPACLEFLRSLDPELLFNYTRDFQRGYYSELSLRLSVRHGVDEKRIILGYGCEDILKEAVHHFLTEGDRLLVPSASWWYYRAVADEVGGVTVEYPLVETPTAYVYDLERLIELRETPRLKLLLLASPNNPTGNAIERGALLKVLEHYRDVPVVLDQAYFGFTNGSPDDVGRLTELFPNLLVLRTFSKLYALAGARIGYALAGPGLAAFQKFCSRNLGYNRISERLALTALESGDYYDGLRRRMARDRARLYALFRGIEGARVYDSEANFVLARFPTAAVAGIRAALRERGFVIKFFADEPAFQDCARISLGTPEETERLIAAFQEILPRTLATASMEA
jgi:histidinol-phosphate aminotransferase